MLVSQQLLFYQKSTGFIGQPVLRKRFKGFYNERPLAYDHSQVGLCVNLRFVAAIMGNKITSGMRDVDVVAWPNSSSTLIKTPMNRKISKWDPLGLSQGGLTQHV